LLARPACDEGHRLKCSDGNNQTYNLLQQSAGRFRIVLTGTPLQNNLPEFFSLVDFVRPGLLGPIESFRRYGEGVVIMLLNKEVYQHFMPCPWYYGSLTGNSTALLPEVVIVVRRFPIYTVRAIKEK